MNFAQDTTERNCMNLGYNEIKLKNSNNLMYNKLVLNRINHEDSTKT